MLNRDFQVLYTPGVGSALLTLESKAVQSLN